VEGRPVTKSKEDLRLHAQRLYELEQRMIAFVGRGQGRLEHEMSEAWEVQPRQVRQMMDQVRARWEAEAPGQREERRNAMRRSLEELAYSSREQDKLAVTVKCLDMLIALDGLAEPTKSESSVTVTNAPDNDSPMLVMVEALRLVAPEERERVVVELLAEAKAGGE
jgi:hypothetical protein